MERIRAEAIAVAADPEKRNAAYVLRRWWVDKYNLPPNHELFMSRSIGDLVREMVEDYAAEHQELAELTNRDDVDQSKVSTMLENLEVALGMREKGQFSNDPVIERWEKALEETGEFPEDFYVGVHPVILGGRRKREEDDMVKKPLPTRLSRRRDR